MKILMIKKLVTMVLKKWMKLRMMRVWVKKTMVKNWRNLKKKMKGLHSRSVVAITVMRIYVEYSNEYETLEVIC